MAESINKWEVVGERNSKPLVRLRSSVSVHAQIATAYRSVNVLDQAVRAWAISYGDVASENSEIAELRYQAYDLCRNNPLALGAIMTHETHTIGSGLELQARVDRDTLKTKLGIDDEEAMDKWEYNVEARFQTWAERPYHCDVEGQLSFYDMTCLQFRTELVAGDSCLLMPSIPRRNSPFRLKFQVIDPARLCNPDNMPDEVAMEGGVGRDGNGFVTEYAFRKANEESTKLGDLGKRNQWERVPAWGARTGRQNVAHLFYKDRPGRSRGVPRLAAVATKLKQLDRYTDAEVMCALTNAFFTVFTTTKDGAPLNYGDDRLVENEMQGVVTQRSEVGLGYGNMVSLAEGEGIEAVGAERPNAQFDPFFLAVSRQIAVGLEMPHEIFVKHFTASYSAARGSLLEFGRTVKKNRRRVGPHVCSPVYENWLSEQIANGSIEAPQFFQDPVVRAAWSGHTWIGPPPGQIDPTKETEAEKMQNDMLVKPLADISIQLTGQDWDDNVMRVAREKRKIKKLGLEPVIEAPKPGPDPESGKTNNDQKDANEP